MKKYKNKILISTLLHNATLDHFIINFNIINKKALILLISSALLGEEQKL